MKPPLKIKFVDFWTNFNPKNNFFYNTLSKQYDIIISEEPDYCFFSVYGYENLKYKNCIKILFTGENFVPDFNLCDYALGFHYLDFEDRYMRFPLYIIYDGFFELKNEKANFENLSNRKFCNFVYSNAVNADPLRNYFFHELSKYKKVDSGGRYLNNVGGPVKDKISFIKDYKFTIAFENSVTKGYTTEKIMEPMSVMSLPIYNGNPCINLDFNPESFIWMKDKTEIKKAIEEIVYLDENETAYLDKLSNPWLTDEQKVIDWENKLFSFFEPFFNQPINEIKKIPKFGYTHEYVAELTNMDLARKQQAKINEVKSRIKKLFTSS